MAPVEVLGRDPAREAYRIRTTVAAGPRTAWVPECLVDTSLRPGARPSHQDAYEWIAAHRGQLRDAVASRAAGRTPRPPFDLVTLALETDDAH